MTRFIHIVCNHKDYNGTIIGTIPRILNVRDIVKIESSFANTERIIELRDGTKIFTSLSLEQLGGLLEHVRWLP